MKTCFKLFVLILGLEFCGMNSRAQLAPEILDDFSADASAPVLSIARTNDVVKITFSGTLEYSDSPAGPWFSLASGSNSVDEPLNKERRFYRSRENSVESIFSSDSVVVFSLTGLMQENFDKAYAGTPDGIFPPVREKPYFPGVLKMGALQLPVTLRVRGNSSLQECPFPKMKLKIDKDVRVGTPFFDAREIKINTHCADGGRGNIGRLRDERAAWREALAYEVMDSLGFTTPRIRRARIEYHDTGAVGELGGGGGWQVTRNAMIFDDVEVLADRLGGRPLADEEIALLTKENFDQQLLVDLEFLHALLGNWDFSLALEGRGLWNTEVIELANKTLLPLAGDFDLASFVTETVRSFAPTEYHPELGDVERQALYTLEAIRARHSQENFAAARERFSNHRSNLETAIASAEIDEAGRTNAERHTRAFFDALDEMKR